MSEESTIPDPLEATRQVYAALNRRDLDAIMGFVGSGCVLDASQWGLGIHTGPKAIRELLDDWYGRLAVYGVRVVEIQDFGHGVVFVVHKGYRGTTDQSYFELEAAPVYQWVKDALARVTVYTDNETARAAAARLAAELG